MQKKDDRVVSVHAGDIGVLGGAFARALLLMPILRQPLFDLSAVKCDRGID